MGAKRSPSWQSPQEELGPIARVAVGGRIEIDTLCQRCGRASETDAHWNLEFLCNRDFVESEKAQEVGRQGRNEQGAELLLTQRVDKVLIKSPPPHEEAEEYTMWG